MNQSRNEQAQQLLRQAEEAQINGDMKAMTQWLRDIIQLAPFHREANAHLAWLGSQTGQYREAFVSYLRLLVSYPFSLHVYARTLQCGCFLVRRMMDRLEERVPFFSSLRRMNRTLLEQASIGLSLVHEADSHTVSRWQKHHRDVQPMALVNRYEYYKVSEIKFASEALGDCAEKSVLDLGSGRSGWPLFLAKQGCSVCAAELDITPLKTQVILQRDLPEIPLTVVSANFLHLPFKKAQFDAITLISTIEHVPENGDMETVRQCAEVLKPGGSLIITVPAGTYATEEWMDHSIGHVYDEATTHEGAQGFLRVYTPELLQSRLVEPSGLRLVRQTFIGETTEWGWGGLGRNYTDRRGGLHPSLFAGPLTLRYAKELNEDELGSAQWVVGCLHLRKEEA